MSDGITPNFGLVKPDVGGSDDTWGDKLNSNFDIIDAALADAGSGGGGEIPPEYITETELAGILNNYPSDAELAAALNTKVAKAGDTMTGALTLPGDPVAPLQATPKQYVDNKVGSVPAPPVPATIVPIVEGVGAIGTSLKYAREDHVHPAGAGGGGGIADAPNDGAFYSRRSAAWTRVGFNVMDYGAKADGVTDDSDAIIAAVNAADAYIAAGNQYLPGAMVRMPGTNKNYMITKPIPMKRGVSLYGDGGTSTVIFAKNTDGLVFGYTSGYGAPTIEGIMISGWNPVTNAFSATASRKAIRRTPVDPTNSDDSMGGLTLRDIVIDSFDTGIDVTTIQDATFDNCIVRRVNQGLVWRGFGGNSRLSNFQVFKLGGGGVGAGTLTGIDYVPVTYTSGAVGGSGPLGPEGIVIDSDSMVNGFDIGINLQRGYWFVIRDSNVVALRQGIKFDKVGLGLIIADNIIEMQTVNATAGIYGVGQSAVQNTQTIIRGNTFINNGTPTADHGIQINEVAGVMQDNVSIQDNVFIGLKGYDIVHFNPGGRNLIQGNRCLSPASVGSMYIGTAQSGMLTIRDNSCQKDITYLTPANLTGGAIRRSNNIINGGTREPSSWDLQSAVAPYFNVAGPTALRTYTFPDFSDSVITALMLPTYTREKLTAARTYYVYPGGNNSNSGLGDSAGLAFATIQKAVDVISSLDISIYPVTIQVRGPGTFAGASINAPWLGSGLVTLKGDIPTPANIILSSPILAQNNGTITVEGFKFVSNDNGFTATLGGAIIFRKMDFGACVGNHLIATDGGQITNDATPYTISGGAVCHFVANGAGAIVRVQSINITLTGTPAFGGYFAQARMTGVLAINGGSYTGAASAGTTKYYVDLNAVINSGVVLPGGVAGVPPSNGGQYV
jgi:hypothetical protein